MSDLGNMSDRSVTLTSAMVIDRNKQYQIKGVKYFYKSRVFWQFFAIMVLGNYFGTFFSYSYKPFGEATSPHD